MCLFAAEGSQKLCERWVLVARPFDEGRSNERIEEAQLNDVMCTVNSDSPEVSEHVSHCVTLDARSHGENRGK